MNPDDLDPILLSEKQIEPSPSFTRTVMARVLATAPDRRPIPFPWIPFSIMALILILASAWSIPGAVYVHAMNSVAQSIGLWFISHSGVRLGHALLSGLACVLATLLLVRISFGLAGAAR